MEGFHEGCCHQRRHNLLIGSGLGATAEREPLIDFIVAQGCAVGSATRVLANDAGYGDDEIDALIAQAGALAGTIRTGDWVVLPTSLCRIRPPEVRSEIRIDDTDVEALTSAIDAYAEFGDRGCFLDGSGLMERTQRTRGWDLERAYLEYVRFLAENLRTGDLAFYKNDPRSTPAGIQILTGPCADVPQIDAIRRSQALRDREFDTLIRTDAPNVVCGRDSSPSYLFPKIVQERTGGEDTNAWLSAEVRFIAIGAGWYIGSGATQKGIPRPPLCHFG